MRTLRQVVSEQMVRVHQVRPELVEEWVRKMDAAEVKRRFKFYTGMKLSAVNPNPRAGNAVSAQALRPATMTADSRRSTAFPATLGRPMPDSEEKKPGQGWGADQMPPPERGF
jgi:hypothetical protein